jgi:hypothetical protein
MPLGKLVKSSSHIDWICQIFGPGEIESPPVETDFGFGTFVCVSSGDNESKIVGLIYDTVLLNPDFGNLGPRLSSAQDLGVFSPDYLVEKATLVGIKAIGTFGTDGSVTHGVPTTTAQIDALVERMDDEGIRRFHRPVVGDQVIRIGYAPLLLSSGTPLSYYLLLRAVDRLALLFPEQSARLSILRSELAWQAVIGPVGGAR